MTAAERAQVLRDVADELDRHHADFSAIVGDLDDYDDGRRSAEETLAAIRIIVGVSWWDRSRHCPTAGGRG